MKFAIPLLVVAIILIGYVWKKSVVVQSDSESDRFSSDSRAIASPGDGQTSQKSDYDTVIELIMGSDVDTIKVYIEQRKSQGFVTPEGYDSPVLRAAQVELWEICYILLESGSDPFSTNKIGETIINMAFTSNIKLDTYHGEQVVRTREWLKERGFDAYVYDAGTVRNMLEKNQWPPQ